MKFDSDVLVIGSGIAGLSYALKAARFGTVHVVTKNRQDEGATRYAQGGIASVFSKSDSFASHINDTEVAGAGLCHRNIVELTVQEGPARVQELVDLGVAFDKDTTSGEYDLTIEGGHEHRRVFHSRDFTGEAIETALVAAVSKHPNIRLFENHAAVDLLTNVRPQKLRRSDGMRCQGAYVLNSTSGAIHVFSARVTVLATGGAGKVYLYTSNPDVATGDGIAMAYRAGARVANLEFMQFHPTCMYHPRAKSFLISEALRGEGGELIDASGAAFMQKYHSMGSCAPRDIVARAIDSEIKRQGADCVYLDITPKRSGHTAAALKERFPNIYAKCREYGIDLTTEPIPVVPAAHYMCGGVLTDEHGESTIENLFAIGETACTGLHGANRLASNSLLEGAVFAHRAALRTEERLRRMKPKLDLKIYEALPDWDSGKAVPMEERINIAHTWRELRTTMWNYVGIVRTNRRLEKARTRLDYISHEVQEYYWSYLLNPELIELRNLVTVADLIVRCALARKESRGLHANLDTPYLDDTYFKRDTIV
ncbi:MAG TPA: L-aspartate oxidase [Oligoflexia bacterium]|nr:L-aspartate oxidase [Oligoflexia bacterium]